MPRLASASMVAAYLSGNAWMLHGPTLDSLISIVARHERGETVAEERLATIIAEREDRSMRFRAEYDGLGAIEASHDARGAYVVKDGVGVVPIHGVLSKHAGMVGGASQPPGMSWDRAAAVIEAALADPRCESVLLDVDSPGGTVAGADDFLARVRSAKSAGGKAMVGLGHDKGCSGGYMILAQCDRIWCSRAAIIGSLGAFVVVEDSSRAAEAQGVTRRVVASFGAVHKGAGERGTPVTPEQIAEVQRNADALGEWFVAEALMAGRGMDKKTAMTLADGRVWIGKESVDAGLCDGVTTLGELVRAMRDSAE